MSLPRRGPAWCHGKLVFLVPWVHSDLRVLLVCKSWEAPLTCSECQNWVIELNGDQLLLLSSQVENTNAYSKEVSSIKSFLTFRLFLVIPKLIRDASFLFIYLFYFSGPYRMCRLDSSLSIVLIWVHLCLPMALMKNLVSVFVWSIFSIAEFLKVVISWQKGGEAGGVGW